MRTLPFLVLLALCITAPATRVGRRNRPGVVTTPAAVLEAGPTADPLSGGGQPAETEAGVAQAAGIAATSYYCCGSSLPSRSSWTCGNQCLTNGTTCSRVCPNFGVISVTCNGATGTWTGGTSCPAAGSCKPALLPPITGGSWTGACSTSYYNTAPGTTCTATCAAGFTGSVRTTCLWNGVDQYGAWNGTSGSCVPAASSCPVANLPSLANGAWVCSTANGGVVATGGSCTGKCNTDYSGTVSIKCTNGAWGSISGACTLIPSGCPATGTGGPGALPPNAASWNCAGLYPSKVPKNFACMATCRTGYVGTVYRTCNDASQWDPLVGNCYPSSTAYGCSTVNMPDVPNSQWDCYWNPPTVVPEQGCLASCIIGIGRPATSCNGQTGTWRTPVGTCTSANVAVCPYRTLPRFSFIVWKCTGGADNGQSCLGSCANGGSATGGIGTDVYLPCINGNWGYLGVPGRFIGTCPSQPIPSQAAVANAAEVTPAATTAPVVTDPAAVPVPPPAVVTEAGKPADSP